MRLFGLGPSHQEARKPKEAALFANKIQCAGWDVLYGQEMANWANKPNFNMIHQTLSGCLFWPGLCQPVKGGAGLRQMLQMIQTKRRTASHVL